MRIIGGRLKGRLIKPGKKFKARPTTDIAKEGLFNILQNRYDFETLKVLDLFSGTGGIGFEFASRDCLSVTMVEKNFNHFNFIRQSARELELNSIEVVKNDAFKFIMLTKKRFNLIFADPPFELPFIKEIPERVFASDILESDGLFILEHPKNYDFSDHPNFQENRKYGHVNFSFFKKE